VNSSYSEIEVLLKIAFSELFAILSAQDCGDVEEYLDHGEYGVTYDLLKFVAEREGVALPESLMAAGRVMNVPD
jgi:hypothetical protein